MYGLGDVFAQVAESYKYGTPLKLDWKRIGVITFFGTFLSGPLYHYWFAYLDVLPMRMLQMRKSKQKWEILRAYKVLKEHNIPVGEPIYPGVKPFHKYTVKTAKILADQLIFSSLYTGFFFLVIGTLNGIAGVQKTHGPPHETTEEGEHAEGDGHAVAKVVPPTSPEKEEMIRSLRAIRTEHNAAALDDLINKLEKGEEKDLKIMGILYAFPLFPFLPYSFSSFSSYTTMHWILSSSWIRRGERLESLGILNVPSIPLLPPSFLFCVSYIFLRHTQFYCFSSFLFNLLFF